MSAESLLSWFRAAQRRWPLVRWNIDRFECHVGAETPSYPEDLYLGGAASERLDPAWEAIHSDFREEVLRRVTRIGRGPQEAEDLWGEAIARLISEDPDGTPLPSGRRPGRIRRFRGSVPLPSYISVVAKRIAMDRMRRDAVSQEIRVNRASAPTTTAPSEDASANAELADRFATEFAQAFISLTPTMQALLSLVYGQGMGKAEAGRLLGLRDYQVSRELRMATESLRDRLELLRPGTWSPEAAEAWARAWTALSQGGREGRHEQT